MKPLTTRENDMSDEHKAQDPLEFVRGMWSNLGFSLPGMITPTLDTDELDKQIADLKAVENWLKMNLNMLQMTIQGLEMQRVALAAVKAMSEQARQGSDSGEVGGESGQENPFSSAMWPWNLMGAQSQAEPPPETNKRRAAKTVKPRRSRKPPETK